MYDPQLCLHVICHVVPPLSLHTTTRANTDASSRGKKQNRDRFRAKNIHFLQMQLYKLTQYVQYPWAFVLPEATLGLISVPSECVYQISFDWDLFVGAYVVRKGSRLHSFSLPSDQRHASCECWYTHIDSDKFTCCFHIHPMVTIHV